jgi:hypothetical protein
VQRSCQQAAVLMSCGFKGRAAKAASFSSLHNDAFVAPGCGELHFCGARYKIAAKFEAQIVSPVGGNVPVPANSHLRCDWRLV